MNPVLEYLPPDDQESFFAQAFEFPYFATPWHYHHELELVLVVDSHGKRFIGNTISDFNAGDLTFFGPKIPHLYKNPPEYYCGHPVLRARSIVIHFSEQSLGKDLLQLPQAKKLKQLFDRSRRGMDIVGEARTTVVEKMYRLLEVKGLLRLIRLLDILNFLADTKDYTYITEPFVVGHNPGDAERLERVFQYTRQNFHREIRLEELASLVFMTRTSFCRFFQERTKRSFFAYLTDLRLNQSSRMLIETDKSVADIAYNCGYNNLSNFNRHFKTKFTTSPKSYRQVYAKATKHQGPLIPITPNAILK
jgi:AraC-like DNA-binding protein